MPQRLAQHLIARGLLPASAVDEGLKRLKRDGGSLDTALLEMGVVSEAGVLQAISDVAGVRLVNLADFEPNQEAGPLMPFKVARQLGVVPLSVDGDALHIASQWPVPQQALKEAGFLLGRKLELWVALECRVRDWQSVLYGAPLEPRYVKLLAHLDPTRKPPPSELEKTADDSLSPEVLERLAQGIVEEPLLLTKPKRKDLTVLGDDEDPRTMVLDPTAYSRFASGGESDSEGQLLGDVEHTRVLDTTGYAAFARKVTDATGDLSTSGALRFPGGVLPPRPSGETRPPPIAPVPSAPAAPAAVTKPAKPPRPPGKAPSGHHRAPPQPNLEDAPPFPSEDELDFEDLLIEPSDIPAHVPPEPAPKMLKGGQLARPSPGRFDTTPLTEAPKKVAPAPTPHYAMSDVLAAAPTPPADQNETLEEPPPPLAPPPSAGVESAAARASSTAPTDAVAPVAPAPGQARWSNTAAWDSSESAPPPSREPVPLGQWPEAGSAILLAPPGLAASSALDWTLAQARASLKNVSQDREQLVSVILDYGRRAFDFVAAFAVMRGAAVGWDARGTDEATAMVRQLAVPLDVASVWRTVALTRGSYVGPLPPDALSQHYLTLLGRQPRTVFLWPIEVRSRLVAMLYGDCGTRPVSQRRLSDFILFCQDLPQAFHDLIAYRKHHAHASPELTQADALPETPSSVPTQAPSSTDGDWYDGLIHLLTGPDPSERAMAMMELMKTPEASAMALQLTFPGPTGWSRLPVVELPNPDELGPVPGALARLGQAGAQAVARLMAMPDSDTRYLALLTAGSLRYPEVVPAVLQALFDFEPDISSAARVAAASLKDLPAFQALLPDLRRELATEDPLRRSLGARALGVLHDRESVDVLVMLTGNSDALCAQSAADALKEITRASFGTDRDAWANWWSMARGRRRIEWLVDALDSDDYDLRLASIEELSRAFGDNYGYFADGPPAERASSVASWRAAVASRPELEL